MKTKVCRTCKEYLPIDLFYTDKQGYTRTQCKLCKNKKESELYKKRGIPKKKSREARLRDNNKRRASINNNGHSPYTEIQVIEKYGDSCHICGLLINLEAPRQCGIEGWEIGLHIEHLIPISKGGPDTLDNVRPSHGWCNITKGAK